MYSIETLSQKVGLPKVMGWALCVCCQGVIRSNKNALYLSIFGGKGKQKRKGKGQGKRKVE